MANHERGEVGIEVGGKTYTLRPTFNGVCELEALTGKSLEEITGNYRKGPRPVIRALVWAYLQEYHAGEIKTLKDASTWIEKAGGVDGVSSVVARIHALNADERTAEEKREDGADPLMAQAGTGDDALSPLAVTA